MAREPTTLVPAVQAATPGIIVQGVLEAAHTVTACVRALVRERHRTLRARARARVSIMEALASVRVAEEVSRRQLAFLRERKHTRRTIEKNLSRAWPALLTACDDVRRLAESGALR